MSEQQITIEDLMQEIKDYADSRRGAFVRREGDLYLKLEQFASQQRADAVQQLQRENAELKCSKITVHETCCCGECKPDERTIGVVSKDEYKGVFDQFIAYKNLNEKLRAELAAAKHPLIVREYCCCGECTNSATEKEVVPLENWQQVISELNAAKAQLAEAENPHVKIAAKPDGVWIYFDVGNGQKAMLNLSTVLPERQSGITMPIIKNAIAKAIDAARTAQASTITVKNKNGSETTLVCLADDSTAQSAPDQEQKSCEL